MKNKLNELGKTAVNVNYVGSDLKFAFKTRKNATQLSEEEKQLLEIALCQNPAWAFYLRFGISGISEEMKLLAEKNSQKIWRGTKEALQAINSVFPRWALYSILPYVEILDSQRVNEVFCQIEGIPVFGNGLAGWKLISSGKIGYIDYPYIIDLSDLSLRF